MHNTNAESKTDNPTENYPPVDEMICCRWCVTGREALKDSCSSDRLASVFWCDEVGQFRDADCGRWCERYANHTETRNGKASAVCSCCNRKSRPVEVCRAGEPDLLKMPQGWSQAPFPADFQHRDGSRGSTYTCPECNKRLRRGETLKLRGRGD